MSTENTQQTHSNQPTQDVANKQDQNQEIKNTNTDPTNHTTEDNTVETQTEPQDYIEKVIKNFVGNDPQKAKEKISKKHNIPLKLLEVTEDEKIFYVKRR